MTTHAIPPALKFWRLVSAWVLVLVAVLQIGTVLYGLIMKVNEIYVLVTPFFSMALVLWVQLRFFPPWQSGSEVLPVVAWWFWSSVMNNTILLWIIAYKEYPEFLHYHFVLIHALTAVQFFVMIEWILYIPVLPLVCKIFRKVRITA